MQLHVIKDLKMAKFTKFLTFFTTAEAKPTVISLSKRYPTSAEVYPISNAILGQPCYNIVGSWKPIPILSQYLYNVHTILAWVSIFNNIQILLSNIGTILYQHCMIQYLHCMTQCLHCVLQDIFIIQEKNSKCTNS